MTKILRVFAIALLSHIGWQVALVAQDDTAPPADAGKQSVGERFDAALEQWRNLDKSLKQVIKDYRVAPQQERQALFLQYQALVADSRTAIKELADAANAAYQAAPNKDDRVTTTLVALMVSANNNAEYSQAEEIGQLLSENECPSAAYKGELGAALFCLGAEDKATPLLTAAKESESLSTLGKLCLQELDIRQAEQQADDLPQIKIVTKNGEIVIELFENEAPNTVANFINLAETGYFNGTKWHRVISDFMAQGGKPNNPDEQGPGYRIACECHEDNHRKHFTGSLAMAHAGRDTGGSQFYITHRRTGHLDGKHTVFGRVVKGQEVVGKIKETIPGSEPDELVKIEVLRKREHKYEPKKLTD